MKKALAFLMAAVMLMSMLTACGNKDVADDTKDNNDVSTAEADQAAAARRRVHKARKPGHQHQKQQHWQ